jgi:hypothetical protein
MKAYGGENVQIDIILTSAPSGGEWSASRLCRFTTGERAACIHWIGGWVDLRGGLDDVEKKNPSPYRDYFSSPTKFSF